MSTSLSLQRSSGRTTKRRRSKLYPGTQSTGFAMTIRAATGR
ncbi:hypothetical protein G647_07943 [Cladophialophora carrionii CBS 160.54]|uniref:Uncharacterized protein n=1 Tax=Cladophialophora carrionii CBS 160.54 TaxID=1279043 RepID=V9D4K7_9EURO|nr:uncharacterized protein G647_07943 [Cladophialophora carrionii CBS 160.54]ETI21596.1 hypothetical protein G647_07943 [Cladophialophora carrionii CBS 160.54]